MPKISKQSLAIQSAFADIQASLDKTRVTRQYLENFLLPQCNQTLYEILEQCFHAYKLLIKSTALKKKLAEALRRSNLPSTAGSSVQLKVVRYVFGANCKEEYTYARAIKAAYDVMPADANFVEWLRGQGGPSGIKKRPPTPTPKPSSHELVSLAQAYYSSAHVLSTVKSIEALKPNSDADHSFSLALVRTSETDPSKLEIVFGTSNISLINQVLQRAAKELPDDARTAAEAKLNLNNEIDLSAVIKLEPISTTAEGNEAGAQS
jgi:hypothetical protein